MSSRVNVTLDDQLKSDGVAMAKELGLSLSALIRLSFARLVNKNKLTGLEEGLLDYINGDVERVSHKDFKKELQDMIDA